MVDVSRCRAIGIIAAVTGVTVGCLGDGDATPRVPSVVAIITRNFHDEAHRLDVTLNHDGTRVHSSSYELAPTRGRTWTEERVDGSWGDASAAHVVEVTVDDADSRTYRYTDDVRECFALGPTITTDGSCEPRIAIGAECRQRS